MLHVAVVLSENFNEETNEFVPSETLTLTLEHSLVSLSKWESIFEKPFLSNTPKTPEETLRYIHLMILSPEVPLDFLSKLSSENFSEINAYINAKMTATTFSNYGPQKSSREIITSEVIYHWMFALGVPIEFENRHLNTLLTTLQVISRKNTPAKKLSKSEILRRNAELNAQRRAALGTSG